MIPKIIHYCWFGGNPLPELAQRCLDSWKQHMPEYEIRQWDETNFDIDAYPYAREAYDARKFAFVSDIARLVALEQYGGIYMDVDFEVYQSFNHLLHHTAFAGYEGSRRQPVMMGVIASEPHGEWVQWMLSFYDSRRFIQPDGSLDMTPNTGYFTDRLEELGLVCDGVEKDFRNWLHIYPVDYFCPGLTTGQNVRSDRTVCEHKGLHSWGEAHGPKAWLMQHLPPKARTALILIKRRVRG